jgi:hypothetical protein
MFNWRVLSSDLCRDHAADGKARIALNRSFDLETRFDLPIFNLTPLPSSWGDLTACEAGTCLVLGGQTPAAMHRPWSMLISNYDPVERVSTVHIGTVTLPDVVERYARMARGRFAPL